jgi:aminopeptidase N
VHYDLNVSVLPDDKSIKGNNVIKYKVLSDNNIMQIDLQPPLNIQYIEQNGKTLDYVKMGKNAYFVTLAEPQKKDSIYQITVHYAGKPRPAKQAPWDGGFSWAKDKNGDHFIATSCQGLGASVWWPCKDHSYDEPDSMRMAVTVPKDLTDVSNGRLRRVVDNDDDTRTFEWYVTNPINNYGVNINIGNYVHFSDEYLGEKGLLTLDFYVLPYNLEKAKEQFKQVKLMLQAFEHWFGPYPFYEDGYKLVETPYLGMEHQSSVTYGNFFKNGYLGRDLSNTGWGLKWDFIIIHESGHEWFANNITYKDIADMWIHESFTNYSENLYTEYHFGKDAGSEYVIGTRSGIENDRPIIGTYGVNHQGSGDMYSKGGNMLHTIRQIIDDDEKWRQILRGMNLYFYHQTVTSKQIEDYIIQQSGKNIQKVFDQYLRNTAIPTLEYKFKNDILSYRWTNCIKGFDMPVKTMLENGKFTFIYPSTKWQKVKVKLKNNADFVVERNFYVNTKKV